MKASPATPCSVSGSRLDSSRRSSALSPRPLAHKSGVPQAPRYAAWRCSVSRVRYLGPSWVEDPVGRTPDGGWSSVQNVGVDHRRAHVAVAEQLLDRTDVMAVLEQMRRE